MNDLSKDSAEAPLKQQPPRGDRVRPTNPFIEFKKEEIEQSIPDRFEKMVRMYPDRLAVKTRNQRLTYNELNKAANRMARAILGKCGPGKMPVGGLIQL